VHPELRIATPLPAQPVEKIPGGIAWSNMFAQDTALANSPRFLEEHPWLLREEPKFEIAPLK
jgi:hypothetical protein